MRSIGEELIMPINELLLGVLDEGTNEKRCSLGNSGQRMLSGIPLEVLIDICFIVSRNVLFDSPMTVFGKNVPTLRYETRYRDIFCRG